MMEVITDRQIETISGGHPVVALSVLRWASGTVAGGLFYDAIKITINHALKPSGRTSTGGQMNRDRRIRQSD